LQGRYGAAERLNKRPLAIHEKALGPDHPDVAVALSNLAVLYFGQSDWPRATDYFRRGTDVIAKRTRHDTQMIGRTLIGKKTTEVGRSSFGSTVFVKSAHRLAGQKPQSHDKLVREMF
jgi:hypothetical protein